MMTFILRVFVGNLLHIVVVSTLTIVVLVPALAILNRRSGWDDPSTKGVHWIALLASPWVLLFPYAVGVATKISLIRVPDRTDWLWLAVGFMLAQPIAISGAAKTEEGKTLMATRILRGLSCLAFVAGVVFPVIDWKWLIFIAGRLAA